MRLAAEDARISFRFLRIGLTPEYGSTHFLVNLVGLGRALEYMLTGRFITAQEAKDAGFVNRVCSPETLVADAVALAQEIADNPEWHLAKVKRPHSRKLYGKGSVTGAEAGIRDAESGSVYRSAQGSSDGISRADVNPNFTGRRRIEDV